MDLVQKIGPLTVDSNADMLPKRFLYLFLFSVFCFVFLKLLNQIFWVVGLMGPCTWVHVLLQKRQRLLCLQYNMQGLNTQYGVVK